MSLHRSNEEAVREEFKKQAKGFSDKRLTLNNRTLLEWILKGLGIHSCMEVLDVAAGTGILSRAVAPGVKRVVSIDISEDMIEEGMRQNQAAGLPNIEYRLANGERILYGNDTFDLVISRLAFHHFAHPADVLREMSRVSTFAGEVCVVDMISPEDDMLCRLYNHYEMLRDPSHTYALKESELISLFCEADLFVLSVETMEVPVYVDRWLELARTDGLTAAQIIKDIERELLTGQPVTGLFPFIDQGETMFKQKWMKMVGKKQQRM
ncbi:class I SAM-dependent methyltransferase [Paenibacillus sp. N4]|uniref:class I SAM-dependent methyltransferase n=1 Tax=Paenibacillus vietnamensis TaxID=2590547 RepID=UPI001CD0EF7D|nr:class I SAM-dependent methyltransferase [Paenibacillus vietnamensis]MCA0757083.1 class I SAM-dependent methyltransferase [Paenibacillus vietnamensis]